MQHESCMHMYVVAIGCNMNHESCMHMHVVAIGCNMNHVCTCML
jgi:hypothetical protein